MASAQFYSIGLEKKVAHKKAPIEEKMDDAVSMNSEEDSIVSLSESTLASFRLMCFPLKHIEITSPFGYRLHPITHKYSLHRGIDLRARYEEVYSMFAGQVVRIGYDELSGNYVSVQTMQYVVSYCHLSKAACRIGDFVNAGDLIAISGNTGRSTGPHLHITIKNDGKVVDASTILAYIKRKGDTNP